MSLRRSIKFTCALSGQGNGKPTNDSSISSRSLTIVPVNSSSFRIILSSVIASFISFAVG